MLPQVSFPRISESDMEMQVFGVLVSPEIGGNTAAAVLRFDLGSYLAYDVQQPVNNGYVVAAQVRQRWDVNFRHHDYVNCPVGPRMVKRQHVVRLSHDLDGRPPAQGFFTIEVVCHRFASGPVSIWMTCLFGCGSTLFQQCRLVSLLGRVDKPSITLRVDKYARTQLRVQLQLGRQIEVATVGSKKHVAGKCA